MAFHFLRAVARWSWFPFTMQARTAWRGLETCRGCGEDMACPIEWHPVDDERWSLQLRCGACGHAREAIASNAEVADYDSVLDRHKSAIRRELAEREADLMALEVDRFVEALRRDLIDAGDFDRDRC